MPGPPDQFFANIGLVFSGPALPYGAYTSLGVLNPWTGGSVPPTDQTALAEAVTDLVDQTCITDVTIDRLIYKVGPNDIGPSTEIPVGTSGGQSSDGQSPQVTLVVRKVVAGVSGRLAGRFAWPGVPDPAVFSSGLLMPDSVEQLQDAFDAFFTFLVDNDYTPCVYTADGSPSSRIVTRFAVQNRVGTRQRRNRR